MYPRRATAAILALAFLTCLTPVAAPAALPPAEAGVPADVVGVVTVEQLLRFTIEDSQLLLATDVPPTSGVNALAVADLPGTTRVDVRLRSRRDRPGMALFFRLMHSSPSDDAVESVQTNVYCRPGYLELSRITRRGEVLETVTLTQAPDVTLRVRRLDVSNSRVTEDSTRVTPTLIDLLRRHPRAAAEHLGPIFRLFGQEQQILGADLRLAWQVLSSDIPADEALRSRVWELVALLDADEFRVRRGAYRELEHIGGLAALVLMRESSRDRLSPEQITTVAAFLDSYHPLTADEAADRLDDRDFLLNCIAYSDNPRIRRAAAERLDDTVSQARDAAGREQMSERIAIVQGLRRELPDVAEATADTE